VILYTSHARPGAAPVLVREGFSRAACVFGAIYLAWRRAWLGAAAVMVVFLLVLGLCRLLHSGLPLVGFAVLQGLLCPDVLRWSLERRGYTAGPVVAAGDPEAALVRLLDARPDLIPPAFNSLPAVF